MSFENLYSFLCSLQLEQYHESFTNAGVTDHDWHQFVQFTEKELDEFVAAVNMLPFHAIKFKKAIRKLHMPLETQEESHPAANDNNSILATTQEFIKTNAVIYGKNKKRELSLYEEAINRASLELALEDPLLISKKGQLFTLAKKKLLEDGYEYKRGSSRSKLKQDNNSNTSPRKKSKKDQTNQTLLLKRQENAQRTSMKRLEKITLLTAQVDEAIHLRQQTEKKLSECQDDVLSSLQCKADLFKFEETKVRLSRELSKLKAKERKHQWYKKRKSTSSLSSLSCLSNNNDEDEGFFSSQQSSNNDFSIYQSTSFDVQEDHHCIA